MGTVLVTGDMRLLKVDASTFVKMGSTHIAALLSMRFVSHASLNVARKPRIEMGSLGLKKCTFFYDLVFFTFSVM